MPASVTKHTSSNTPPVVTITDPDASSSAIVWSSAAALVLVVRLAPFEMVTVGPTAALATPIVNCPVIVHCEPAPSMLTVAARPPVPTSPLADDTAPPSLIVRLPVPERPTVSACAMVHVELAPSTVAVPVLPMPQPTKALSASFIAAPASISNVAWPEAPM